MPLPHAFLSSDGRYALALLEGWRVEAQTEDGDAFFFRSGFRSVIRVSGFAMDALEARIFPEGYLRGADDPPGFEVRACTVNGRKAGMVERVRQGASGRVMRRREWAVTDGTQVVLVQQEVPESVGEAEDAEVDRLVQGLELRQAPHPTVRALIKRLALSGVQWEWNPDRPLVVRCPEGGEEADLEDLVRQAQGSRGALERALEATQRRIRQFHAFCHGRPDLEDVREGILPILRGEVLLEGWDPPSAGRPAVLATDPARPSGPAAMPVLGQAYVRRQWGPDLYVYYALEVPGALLFLRRRDLERWGLDEEQLDAIALANLDARVGEERFDLVGPPGRRLVVIEDGEGLAPSRLLLPRFVEKLMSGLGDDFGFSLPTAGVLVARSAAFEAWVQALGEDLWEAYRSGPVPITSGEYCHGTRGVRRLESREGATGSRPSVHKPVLDAPRREC